MPNSIENPVKWDGWPDVSTLAMELQVFDYFQSRQFKCDEYLGLFLICDLWQIVFDFFIHNSKYVSLPIKLFETSEVLEHHIIQAEPLLKHFFTRFYGLENGGELQLFEEYVTPQTVSGHCNLYITEFYFQPLRILESSLYPNDRLLFKFEPRRMHCQERKTKMRFHLWPTCGKVFSNPKRLCDYIVQNNPKGHVWMSDTRSNRTCFWAIDDFFISHSSREQGWEKWRRDAFR